MQTIAINTWAEYETALSAIHSKYAQYKIGDYEGHNSILYRGQSDSAWHLETTLDRFIPRPWTLEEYSELIYRCAPQIEAMTGCRWGLPEWPEFQAALERSFNDFMIEIPFCNYWAYLRHHGFPSPLLDWSRSPYIAAFFALESQTTAPYASVYVFIERTAGGKMYGANDAEVHKGVSPMI